MKFLVILYFVIEVVYKCVCVQVMVSLFGLGIFVPQLCEIVMG